MKKTTLDRFLIHSLNWYRNKFIPKLKKNVNHNNFWKKIVDSSRIFFVNRIFACCFFYIYKKKTFAVINELLNFGNLAKIHVFKKSICILKHFPWKTKISHDTFLSKIFFFGRKKRYHRLLVGTAQKSLK